MTEVAQRRARWALVGLAALAAVAVGFRLVSGPEAPTAERGHAAERPARPAKPRWGFLDAPRPALDRDARAPGKPMRGTVVDAAGAPVPDVDVLVFESSLAAGPLYLCPQADQGDSLFSSSCSEANDAFFEALDSGRLEAAPVVSARTNAAGEFAFEAPSEPFDLWVERGSDFAVELELAPDASEPIELTLGEGTQVHGTVNANLSPAAGVEIVLAQLRPLRVFRATTGSGGTFAFPRLPVGEVFGIGARARDLLPSIAVFSEVPVELELLGPGVVSGVVRRNGVLAAGAIVVLEGTQRTVVDGDGRFSFPRTTCEVCEVTAEQGDRFARADVTLDEARRAFVELDLLPVGELRVHVADRSTAKPVDADVDLAAGATIERLDLGVYLARQVSRGRVDVSVSAEGYVAAQLRVEIGPGVTDVEVLLEPELRVEGLVLGPDGAPVPDAQLWAYPLKGGSEVAAGADEQGRFELHGLGAGTYRISATHPLYLREDVQWVLPTTSPITIALRAAGRLHVLVVDPAGQPVADATVTLKIGLQPAQPKFSISDSNGDATFLRLPPGAYEINAAAQDFAPSETTAVQVSVGESYARATLKAGLSLKGRVLDDTGAPVEAVEVTAVPDQPVAAPHVPVTVSDASGRFELRGLLDVPYRVAARSEDGVEVTARPGPDELTLRVDRAATVTGRVVQGGVPVATGFSVDGAPFFAPDGTFEVSLPPGWTELRITGAFAPQVVKVELRPGARLALGDVSVEGGSSLEGLVTLGAQPAVDLSITVVPADDPLGEQQALTDADGRFRLGGLAPGRYEVSGSGPRGTVPSTSVVVGAGGPTSVHLQASAAGRLVGQVLDTSGMPSPFAQIEATAAGTRYATICGRAGEFELDGLPPGDYAVAAITREGAKALANATLHPLAEARVEIQVPAPARRVDPEWEDP